MKKIAISFLLLLFVVSTAQAQRPWAWTSAASVGYADNEFGFSSYRNLYDFQKGAPTFTFSVGCIYSPWAKKSTKKKVLKTWQRYGLSNLKNTSFQASIGARKLSYTGFTHISNNFQSPEKYTYNIRERIQSYYATLNTEIDIPISPYISFLAAYEKQFLITASRSTDEYYLSETQGKNYNIQDVSKDNFTDSLRRNDAFLRIGFSIKTSNHTRLFTNTD